MPTITLAVEEVRSSRLAVIADVLYPLRDGQVPCQRYRVTVDRGWVLAAHSGGSLVNSHYDYWRFRTMARNIDCQYYEHWKFVLPDETSMFLNRAYLHLYQIDRSTHTSEQMLCIHTDPDDE